MRGTPKLCQPSAQPPTRPQTGPQASTLSGVTDTLPTLIALQQRHPKTDFFSTENLTPRHCSLNQGPPRPCCLGPLPPSPPNPPPASLEASNPATQVIILRWRQGKLHPWPQFPGCLRPLFSEPHSRCPFGYPQPGHRRSPQAPPRHRRPSFVFPFMVCFSSEKVSNVQKSQK